MIFLCPFNTLTSIFDKRIFPICNYILASNDIRIKNVDPRAGFSKSIFFFLNYFISQNLLCFATPENGVQTD